MTRNSRHILISCATGLILFLGILLRCILFSRQRSLFIDEANLARNYYEKSFAQLFGHLDYDQFAPPFFSVIQKLFFTLFEFTEHGLWVFPLLSGISSLFLFYFLCRHFLSPVYILYPLFLISFLPSFVEYSVIAKQYATDVLITVSLLLLALKVKPDSIDLKKTFLWASAGSLATWLSMPSIFVLGAIGLYYLSATVNRNSLKQLAYVNVFVITWAGSFLAYYLVLLKPQIGLEYLQNYHQTYFIKFPPASLEEVVLLYKRVVQIFTTAFDQTALGIGWGVLCFSIGLIKTTGENYRKALLVITPVILCLVAAALNRYSLIPRLTLFFIPLILLLSGKGVEWFLYKRPLAIKVGVVVVLMITAYNAGAFKYFCKPFEKEEIKQVLHFMVDNKKEDEEIFLHHLAEPAFIFYTRQYKYKDNYPFTSYTTGDSDADWTKLHELIKTKTKIWIIFTNISKEHKDRHLQTLNSIGTRLSGYDAFGASCYLYNMQIHLNK